MCPTDDKTAIDPEAIETMVKKKIATYIESKKETERLTFIANKRIGANIARIRKEQGLTLKDLAERTGFSQSALQRYEVGKVKNVSFTSVYAIAAALGTEPENIMGWQKAPGTPTTSALRVGSSSDLSVINEQSALLTIQSLIDSIEDFGLFGISTDDKDLIEKNLSDLDLLYKSLYESYYRASRIISRKKALQHAKK